MQKKHKKLNTIYTCVLFPIKGIPLLVNTDFKCVSADHKVKSTF
jgi:hypothetical protein